MKKALLLIAVASTFVLAACDREPVIVNAPASTVPGPAGPAGATGDTGSTGSTGSMGSTGSTGAREGCPGSADDHACRAGSRPRHAGGCVAVLSAALSGPRGSRAPGRPDA